MLYLLRCCCCWRECCFFWKTDGTNDFFLVNVLPLPVKFSVGVSGFLCCWRLGDVAAPSNCCFGCWCWWWWCRPLEFEEVGVVTVPVPPWDTANYYIQLFICIVCIFITHISCVAHYVHENIWNTDHQIGNYHNSHIPVCISDLAEAYAVAPCLTCRRFEPFTTFRILFSIAFQFVDRYFWLIF